MGEFGPIRNTFQLPEQTGTGPAMKIAVFRHEPDEPPGYFMTVFAGHGIPCDDIPLYETGELPRTDATHLVFLGGSMSVNDEAEYPFLAQEKALIRNAVKCGRRVLGICLGAQLIAAAFGAPVYRFVQETGWHRLTGVPSAADGRSLFPAEFFAFQLHRETFGMPYGGRLLASGDRVKHQAFSCRGALGLQFHLELTAPIIEDWARGMRRPVREKIARETPRHLAESNRLCRAVAEDFIHR